VTCFSCSIDDPSLFFTALCCLSQGVFADDDAFYMVMELAAGGELYDRLTMEGVFLEDYEVRGVLRDTADALAYMHDMGIVHGDVKPENILLSTPAAGGHDVGRCSSTSNVQKEIGRLGKALLADFGSSFRLPKSSDGRGRRMVKAYTAAYSAPEVVLNGCLVDDKADVWSLGVIAYVMVSLFPMSLASWFGQCRNF